MKKLLSLSAIEKINKEIMLMYSENKCNTKAQYDYCHRHILKKHKISESLFRTSSEAFLTNDDDFDY